MTTGSIKMLILMRNIFIQVK